MSEALEREVGKRQSQGLSGTTARSSPANPGRQRDVRNPFPGLRPFLENEEQFFFGRESQTDVMVDKLAASRFLTVIGSSGSGKSSLVNCGLRVALHGGSMSSAGTHWRIAQFRPGGDPIGAMARALAAEGVLFQQFESAGMPLADIFETNLRMSRMGLVDVVEQARCGDDVNVLVVVDQFEELFRFRQKVDKGDTIAFVNLLLETCRQAAKHRIYIVLTMRSDFLGDCSRYPGLAETINDGQYLVPQMTREERRLAIKGPVTVSGATMAPVLLTRLINDLGDDPDQLSVLQHALNRIWSAWSSEEDANATLNLRHYSAIGSMANALDRHAEKAYAELDPDRQQPLARKMFQALTDKSTDTRGVRRPTPLRTLCAITGASSDEVVDVIDVFRKPSRSFLMPPASESLEPETVIDISHESLMRKWLRLIDWADEEARSTQTYRRLAETASLHAAGKAGLWRDPDLQIALDWKQQTQPTEAWSARYQSGFSEALQFLDDSAAARDAERLKEQESTRRQQELDQARALADEQSSRLAAQARVAQVQKRDIRIISAALVVSTTLAALTIWQTLSANHYQEAANVALDQKESVVKAYASDSMKSTIILAAVPILAQGKAALANQVGSLTSSIQDAEIKKKAIWKLIAKGELTRDATPASVVFTNAASDTVLLLSLTETGEETAPMTLAAGETATLEWFVNDIWVARSAAGGQVIGADVVDGDITISLAE